MSDLLSLDGRIALVTGAGQGIGAQISRHFAEHGARAVIVNDYFLDRAQAVADEITAAGGSAFAVQGDVTDHAGMKALAESVREAHGPIDILVNNAGNSGANPAADVSAPFWETGPETWDSQIGVNFYGVLNSTAAVVPAMIEHGYGRIVTIISEASRYGDPGLEVYAGAKAGAAGFTRATARALGRHGVTANCVAIAATLTPAIEDRLAQNPERLKKMMSKYVIRRPGRPSDVANAVLFLASDAAEYITGQTYPVNGGFTFNL
ncbi:SDR family NAD(P)-dependent oxidoreductase [Brevibacterium album]|uniref:SDR family NAD(P)-dependent oxidoreductase n=1 Tax=Brevibacterium album TaxID=417948 RepID=UPI0004226F23|nr:SDR family oxidoreductase [Brevibacterium album]